MDDRYIARDLLVKTFHELHDSSNKTTKLSEYIEEYIEQSLKKYAFLERIKLIDEMLKILPILQENDLQKKAINDILEKIKKQTMQNFSAEEALKILGYPTSSNEAIEGYVDDFWRAYENNKALKSFVSKLKYITKVTVEGINRHKGLLIIAAAGMICLNGIKNCGNVVEKYCGDVTQKIKVYKLRDEGKFEIWCGNSKISRENAIKIFQESAEEKGLDKAVLSVGIYGLYNLPADMEVSVLDQLRVIFVAATTPFEDFVNFAITPPVPAEWVSTPSSPSTTIVGIGPDIAIGSGPAKGR